MKKIDLGQTVAILANLGVIAGIIFLAVELQQNNRLLTAEAQFNLLQNRTTGMASVTDNAELAEFWVKVNSGAPLTQADQLRVDLYATRAILNWQWEFGQFLSGNLELQDLPLEAWRSSFAGSDATRTVRSYPQVWERMRGRVNQEFLDFMDENVVPAGGE